MRSPFSQVIISVAISVANISYPIWAASSLSSAGSLSLCGEISGARCAARHVRLYSVGHHQLVLRIGVGCAKTQLLSAGWCGSCLCFVGVGRGDVSSRVTCSS